MPEPKGKLVTPIGFDSSGNLVAFLIDSDGHVQVDVLTLPSGIDIRALDAATDSIAVKGSDGASLYVLKTDSDGKLITSPGTPKSTTLTIATPIPAGGNYAQVEIAPPTGYKWRIIGMEFWAKAPAGATSGYHRLFLEYASGVRLYRGQSDYTASVYYTFGQWYSANQEQWPSDPACQTLLAMFMEFSEDQQGVFRYYNATNADQNTEPYIRLQVIETPI